MPDRVDPKENLTQLQWNNVYKTFTDHQARVARERAERAKKDAAAAALETRNGYGAAGNGFYLVGTNGFATMFTKEQQAAELDKLLPRNPALLTTIVNDPKTSMELRSKVLELMVFRAASNSQTYDSMARPKAVKDVESFKEHRAYQVAVRDTVFANPDVFTRMSQSPDQLPQGRSAATEAMNTLLKNGGLHGSHEARQDFERRLLAVRDPEVQGRMMYHMLDAGHTADIHQKGERKTTGWSVEISAGTAGGSVGVGIGEQWEHVADNHFREVGRDVTRSVGADLAAKGEGATKAFVKGYADAQSRDRLSVPE